MPLDTIDASEARSLMVSGQLRPGGVANPRLLTAMNTLPREAFLPPSLAARAYTDANVALPGGRALLAPLTLARLLQLADPKAGERVLLLGAGVGYGAAVLAACDVSVVAVEESEPLLALARSNLARFAPQVLLREGPLVAGAGEGAPFDLVFLEGGFELLPPAVVAAVRPGSGRLVGVRVSGRGVGQAERGERVGADAALALRAEFDCVAPVLPGLGRPRGFAL
jgi:protein-L-isoaspartate(D-aspartate) O-methyltransferase